MTDKALSWLDGSRGGALVKPPLQVSRVPRPKVRPSVIAGRPLPVERKAYVEKRDALGRKICMEDGVHVPCGKPRSSKEDRIRKGRPYGRHTATGLVSGIRDRIHAFKLTPRQRALAKHMMDVGLKADLLRMDKLPRFRHILALYMTLNHVPDDACTLLMSKRLARTGAAETAADCTIAWRAIIGDRSDDLREGESIPAFYDSSNRLLFVGGMDGPTSESERAGLWAHAIGDALDAGLSETEEWRSAWKGEIADGSLSKYADASPHTGMAELFRALYGGLADEAAGLFPKSIAFLAARGLAPGSSSVDAKALDPEDLDAASDILASVFTEDELRELLDLPDEDPGSTGSKAYVEKKDKRGRRLCMNNGIRVKCPARGEPSPDTNGDGKITEQEVEGAAKPVQWSSVEQAAEAVRQLTQKTGKTPKDVATMAESLLNMSKAELTELKGLLKVTAYGAKKQMAEMILTRVSELTGSEPVGTGKPADSAWQDAMMKVAVDQYRKDRYQEATFPEMFREAQKIKPDLTIPEFHQAILKLRKEGRIGRLEPYTRANVPEPEFVLQIDREPFYSVIPSDDEMKRPEGTDATAEGKDGGMRGYVERKDSLGRRVCYQDGKRVPCKPKPPVAKEKKPRKPPVPKPKPPKGTAKSPTPRPDQNPPAEETRTPANSTYSGDSIYREFEDLLDAYSWTEQVPIWEVRDRIREKFGDEAASHDVFDGMVLQMWRDGKIKLVAASDTTWETPHQRKGAIPGSGNLLYFIGPVKESNPDREMPKKANAQRVIREILLLGDRDYRDHGMVPIHKLRESIAKIYGPEAAGHAALDPILRELRRKRIIRFVAIGDPSQVTHQELEDSVPGEGETYFSVEVDPSQNQ